MIDVENENVMEAYRSFNGEGNVVEVKSIVKDAKLVTFESPSGGTFEALSVRMKKCGSTLPDILEDIKNDHNLAVHSIERYITRDDICRVVYISK